MINDLKEKSINDDYKKLVCTEAMKFVQGSLKENTNPHHDLCYFISRHKFGIQEKEIHHFIFNVNF